MATVFGKDGIGCGRNGDVRAQPTAQTGSLSYVHELKAQDSAQIVSDPSRIAPRSRTVRCDI